MERRSCCFGRNTYTSVIRKSLHIGNLSPYLTSYMRKYGSAPSLTYTECAWIYALVIMCQGTTVILGGIIERYIGPKITVLLGCWCMSLGVLLTYFSVKHSFALTVVTYGAIFGFGVGIAYAIPLACAMRWFPEWKGLVNGFVVAGFGGGAFIFDQVQTAFINPNNLKPDLEVDGDKYFSQDDVLDQVPWMFLLLGGCYTVMQLIGSLLLCNPPPLESNSGTVEEDNERTAILSDTDTQQLILPSPESAQPVNNQETVPEDDVTVHPLRVLRSKHFYFIWLMFVFNGQGSTFVSTLYKAYGQTFISDDTFMGVVGSFAALFNAFGRIMWGSIADRFSFRVSSLIMCACFTCLMLTLQLSERGGKALFFVYVCLLFGSFSGSYSLFPTATAKCFGRKYLPINYGLVFTSQIITAPIGVFMSQKLKSSLGWDGLFFLVAGCSFVSFLLSMLFSGKDRKGKEI
uniref:Major facilitator superfamily (MFS) profile domain-containing protein n=1 Tax=Arion vulgaris TaxID=1028688 RepID=A0A0B7A8L4_9EUPU